MGQRSKLMTSTPSLFTGGVRSNDDETYALVASDDWFEGDRAWLDEAWMRCAPFLDPNFASRFRVEFHQRAWELRLAWTLLELGLPLVQRMAQGEGPDFEIAASSTHPRTWIEAATVSHGDGVDRVLEPPSRGIYKSDPKAVMLRYARAFQGKWADLRRYCVKGIVGNTDAYVIAINPGSMVRATREQCDGPFMDTPWIVRVLYGIGESFVRIPIGVECHEPEHGIHHQPFIARRSGRPVDSQFFCDPASSRISAVLFGRRDVFNRPSRPGDDFLLVHNDQAAARLPSGWLCGGVEYEPRDGQLCFMDHRGRPT
jgi:hypothetical protein